MKVAFDQQVFILQRYGGISRYLCNLARGLSGDSEIRTRIFAPLHINHNLSLMCRNVYSGCYLPGLPSVMTRPAILASKLVAQAQIKRFRPDIIHETYYSEDDFCPAESCRVLTVYDLIHERYSELFVNGEGTTRPKRTAANRADHVICISESTRRDLIAYCGVPEDRTSVIYLGVDAGFINMNRIRSKSHSRPFVLYVGARGGYKNFDRLVRAFSRSRYLRQEFDLLCFGGGGLTTTERTLAAAENLRPNQIVQMEGGDDILASLYQDAVALVYPSLYEGFGIPPLEAMASGCPVICSNTSSLPEVVGNAAETFDPLDEEAMQVAMEHVLGSADRRNELIEAGHARHLLFTWDKCARETAAVYRGLL